MFKGDKKRDYQREYMRKRRSNKQGLTEKEGLTPSPVRPAKPPEPARKDQDPDFVFVNGAYYKKPT